MRQGCGRIISVMILVSLISLLFGSIGQGGKQPDGYWWNEQPEDVKFFYVYGVIAGTNSTLACLNLLKYEKYRVLVGSGVLKHCPEKYIEAIINYVEKEELFQPFSASEAGMTEILDGMNEFYKDFRNRRIVIDEAIKIVRMQLKEEPPVVIDEMIKYLREKSREGQQKKLGNCPIFTNKPILD